MPGPLNTQLPTLILDGQQDPAISAALILLQVRLGKDGNCSAQLELDNWGIRNGQPDYLFFDDGRIAYGKPLRVDVSGQVLFDGRISAIQAGYPQQSAPTLGLTAAMSSPFGPSDPIQLEYGQGLWSLDLNDSWLASGFLFWSRTRRTVQGEASAGFDLRIVPGVQVEMSGIGERYSGVYMISEVVHTFDRDSGWRTEFVVG